MLYAIIENGGKQYRAEEGSHIEVDLLPEEVGKKKTFENVLLLVNEDEVQVGTPYLQGISVDATVVAHFKAPKITVFKYRPKQRYRVKSGHRQKYSRLVVDSIAFPGKSKTSKSEKGEAEEKAETQKKTRTKTAEKKTPAKQQASKKETKSTPSIRKSVESLDLGARTTNALADAGIKTVGQLIKRMESGEDKMLDISGIGEKSLSDIKKKLKKFGYK